MLGEPLESRPRAPKRKLFSNSRFFHEDIQRLETQEHREVEIGDILYAGWLEFWDFHNTKTQQKNGFNTTHLLGPTSAQMQYWIVVAVHDRPEYTGVTTCGIFTHGDRKLMVRFSNSPEVLPQMMNTSMANGVNYVSQNPNLRDELTLRVLLDGCKPTFLLLPTAVLCIAEIGSCKINSQGERVERLKPMSLEILH